MSWGQKILSRLESSTQMTGDQPSKSNMAIKYKDVKWMSFSIRVKECLYFINFTKLFKGLVGLILDSLYLYLSSLL